MKEKKNKVVGEIVKNLCEFDYSLFKFVGVVRIEMLERIVWGKVKEKKIKIFREVKEVGVWWFVWRWDIFCEEWKEWWYWWRVWCEYDECWYYYCYLGWFNLI